MARSNKLLPGRYYKKNGQLWFVLGKADAKPRRGAGYVWVGRVLEDPDEVLEEHDHYMTIPCAYDDTKYWNIVMESHGLQQGKKNYPCPDLEGEWGTDSFLFGRAYSEVIKEYFDRYLHRPRYDEDGEDPTDLRGRDISTFYHSDQYPETFDGFENPAFAENKYIYSNVVDPDDILHMGDPMLVVFEPGAQVQQVDVAPPAVQQVEVPLAAVQQAEVDGAGVNLNEDDDEDDDEEVIPQNLDLDAQEQGEQTEADDGEAQAKSKAVTVSKGGGIWIGSPSKAPATGFFLGPTPLEAAQAGVFKAAGTSAKPPPKANPKHFNIASGDTPGKAVTPAGAWSTPDGVDVAKAKSKNPLVGAKVGAAKSSYPAGFEDMMLQNQMMMQQMMTMMNMQNAQNVANTSNSKIGPGSPDGSKSGDGWKSGADGVNTDGKNSLDSTSLKIVMASLPKEGDYKRPWDFLEALDGWCEEVIKSGVSSSHVDMYIRQNSLNATTKEKIVAAKLTTGLDNFRSYLGKLLLESPDMQRIQAFKRICEVFVNGDANLPEAPAEFNRYMDNIYWEGEKQGIKLDGSLRGLISVVVFFGSWSDKLESFLPLLASDFSIQNVSTKLESTYQKLISNKEALVKVQSAQDAWRQPGRGKTFKNSGKGNDNGGAQKGGGKSGPGAGKGASKGAQPGSPPPAAGKGTQQSQGSDQKNGVDTSQWACHWCGQTGHGKRTCWYFWNRIPKGMIEQYKARTKTLAECQEAFKKNQESKGQKKETARQAVIPM